MPFCRQKQVVCNCLVIDEDVFDKNGDENDRACDKRTGKQADDTGERDIAIGRGRHEEREKSEKFGIPASP